MIRSICLLQTLSQSNNGAPFQAIEGRLLVEGALHWNHFKHRRTPLMKRVQKALVNIITHRKQPSLRTLLNRLT